MDLKKNFLFIFFIYGSKSASTLNTALSSDQHDSAVLITTGSHLSTPTYSITCVFYSDSNC